MCATKEELMELLGKGRAKKGMFEGDLENGELEIGQIASIVNEILPAGKIVDEIMEEFYLKIEELAKYKPIAD